ncbi:hypothetical protein Z517_03604 [Fonsecaea pedrosoi CBS 271.37]|uniref:Uncharacterized protein n=1 Tax=Fonsecaea pedrosoi CBS 271.37 TaxID=1442368 RepID=A0A0D2HIR9_9EURO|nr:uncharacterized protein Z517_03604 [Fonsecaea pedrosoi CBS 271.37]KIW84354.1 hypothetical protein Z517_03604 [Fonsecaea pedrosoi CBS 271.37]
MKASAVVMTTLLAGAVLALPTAPAPVDSPNHLATRDTNVDALRATHYARGAGQSLDIRDDPDTTDGEVTDDLGSDTDDEASTPILP